MHISQREATYLGIKIKAKCFNCGTKNDIDIEPVVTNGKIKINFVCQNCGALNVLDIDPMNLDDKEQDWLCLPPTGFEWILPSGKIMPIIGDPIYVSAFGEHLSRKVYLERYKVDPEIAYQYMRRKRSEQIGSDISNKSSQHVETHVLLDLSNIKKIEVKCEICGNICELNV
jgi:hypothetical protein